MRVDEAPQQVPGQLGAGAVTRAFVDTSRHQCAPFCRRSRLAITMGAVGNPGEQPVRRVGKGLGAIDRPAVAFAAGVHARRCQDVTAGGARVDPGRNLAGGITQRCRRHSEKHMPAARSDALDGGRQFPVLRFELAHFQFSIEAINVDNKDVGYFARGNGEIERWLLLPPSRNYFCVLGGVFHAVRRSRALVAHPARENRQPTFRQR